MGRMTYQHDGRWCIDGKKTTSDRQANCWGAAIDLLAAYENTGLSPEQIQKAVDLLKDTFDAIFREYNHIASALFAEESDSGANERKQKQMPVK